MKTRIKAIKAMYVYEILLNADNPLTRQEIATKLRTIYNINESLRTLTNFLREMIKADLITAEPQKHGDKLIDSLKEKSKSIEEADALEDKLEKIKRTNYKLKERLLEDSELLWLIDNAIFSKQLSESASNTIVAKLLKLGSKTLKDKVRFLGDNKHYFHASNDDVSNNIKVLSDAIKEGKSVKFTPLEYGLDLKLHASADEICYVKPLRMIPINDFYYLIAFEPESNSIQHYRIDLMRDISDKVENIDYDSFNNKINVNEYLSVHSLMRSGDSKFTKLKLSEEHIGLVIDRFGTNIQCGDAGGIDIFVTLKSNPDDLYVWALEYGEYVEVIEPQSVRNKIRLTVAEMHQKYTCNDLDKYDIQLAKAQKRLLSNHYHFHCPNIKLDNNLEWKELIQLTDITFENNRITDFSFTNTLKNLRKVSFENERIKDLSFLSDLPKLFVLRLKETTISDISCLENLNLSILHLVRNYDLQDYSVLSKMKRLRKLYIDNETLDKINIDELKEINPNLTIWVEPEEGKPVML